MATDVDVQFFSHLNGLVLDNKWGDMIRLLDACLVNGVELPGVTSAAIDEQGDVHLTLFAPHQAMLLQVVELTGFEPSPLNQKYRIKGVPSDTQLILKPANTIAETAITTKGVGKLASLGYDIIFRDDKDVKRVYRAKNPTAQHPFIRVDETISDGVNSYNSSYAKYAMVGLLEHMDHIDDYQNPDVLQLPFDPTNPSKNWKISGAGGDCVRGWSKWYWAHESLSGASSAVVEAKSPQNGNRSFILCGDQDAFYLQRPHTLNTSYMYVSGLGLFDSSLKSDVVPNWFLMSFLRERTAGVNEGFREYTGATPLIAGNVPAQFFTTDYNEFKRISEHTVCNPILQNFSTGISNTFAGTAIPALTIPIYDKDLKLRGALKHINFLAKDLRAGSATITPAIAENSMYVYLPCDTGFAVFYMGELE
ncbi:MAG: hypothetical protein ACN6OV_00580 [Acinetobacter sp.]|uniref:hypothetical protein n=1 Tax=Acinetobacter sp. TaxID=472 RepID=UPI003CFEF6BB